MLYREVEKEVWGKREDDREWGKGEKREIRLH